MGLLSKLKKLVKKSTGIGVIAKHDPITKALMKHDPVTKALVKHDPGLKLAAKLDPSLGAARDTAMGMMAKKAPVSSGQLHAGTGLTMPAGGMAGEMPVQPVAAPVQAGMGGFGQALQGADNYFGGASQVAAPIMAQSGSIQAAAPAPEVPPSAAPAPGGVVGPRTAPRSPMTFALRRRAMMGGGLYGGKNGQGMMP